MPIGILNKNCTRLITRAVAILDWDHSVYDTVFVNYDINIFVYNFYASYVDRTSYILYKRTIGDVELKEEINKENMTQIVFFFFLL